MTATNILNFIKELNCSKYYIKKKKKIVPNTSIAYKILLTILVIVASVEKSFSKVKIIKILLAINYITRKIK